MGLVSALLSSSRSRHKLSSSISSTNPPKHPHHNHNTTNPSHAPMPNPSPHILGTNPQDSHSSRKAERHYEALRQASIDAALAARTTLKATQKAERAKKREERASKREERAKRTEQKKQEAEQKEREEKEREKEEEVKEALKLRFQAVEEKKERHRREGELWRGRFDGRCLEGYCLNV